MRSDELYMARAIELAEKALGKTYPNPMVGAVIVCEDQILGEGYHKKAGVPHAEINAINEVKDLERLKESTIYVSLEPCSHYGRTPPCAERLKELGFKRVVIATLDSNEKVAGRGVSILREAGIEVSLGVLEEKARELNRRFLTFHEKKRPYITLKWAKTQKGFLDHDFSPMAISNSAANQWVHHLRSMEQAIFVGTTTALRDNPSLSVRHVSGPEPRRLVLDLDLKIPSNYHLLSDGSPTVVFNSLKNEESENLKYVIVDKEDLIPNILEAVHKLQIQSVLIEGGASIHRQFLERDLWDEIIEIEGNDSTVEKGTPAPLLSFPPIKELTLRDNTIRFFERK